MTDTGYRVLVVDDHPIFVRGVRNELDDAGDIQAIGECANGTEAVALVEQKRPDVVLIDLRVPPAVGDEAEFCWPDVIRRIVEQALDTKILVLSMLEEPEYVRAVLNAGGARLPTQAREARPAGRAHGGRGQDGSRRACAQCVERAAGSPGRRRSAVRPHQAEYRKLVLMVNGLTKPQIVAELRLSPKTVTNRTLDIQRKLKVRNWNEAVEKARKNRIGARYCTRESGTRHHLFLGTAGPFAHGQRAQQPPFLSHRPRPASGYCSPRRYV
ncbi:MAG TPA: response regulator transcription factor [Actinophytocola sp.]|uniref:response regulator transcription factor n=1 Tax=Actinophytocola sp. TaxID=1872138 RepID=UPI002DB79101|nr:response regulator transcription factor [Actinophytocola sp.]HEU5470175.1 response regulator transcription factor [Actinophytocola sp.]